ncbi:Ig-like domain-containing protein [Solirubrobacter ginsenosidimutans]|uniref:Ig-like domain-containing protein n=1 Tax=Solirubrobacter ginsenosidimutans TaxID=490573 RepID=A0A9X3S472_9ACTN|nr:Ig-like domain-containing protein [Solirubrobacter ginsenosidimutans]MDA0164132.1 Ig-like domain-containing protein [Solirubrobacter ginsenosidimutans]
MDDDKADCPAASYTSVQAAVDAAHAGDTVVICQGEYVEGDGSPGSNAVTITKNITLKGAGADLVKITPKADPLVRGRILEDAPDLRNGVGDIVAIVGTPTQPLTVNISGVTVDGYDPQGREVAVEAGILFLDAKGSIVRSRVTNIVTSEGDNAYTRVGGWRGPQPGIGIVQTSNALLSPVDGARKLVIDRTRVDKYNQIGILIDGAQNDAAPFIASGAINWGVITASQVIGRTECVNFAGTGSCPTVGLLTTGPLFGQDGVRVTSGSYATIDSSLISQNLVNGTGAPTRNSDANNANLTLGAGVRYIAAKIALYASATGQVVYSRIGTSNVVDNAYGVLNVAADGTTAVTGNPNATDLQSQGNLLKAENNWWGLRYNSTTNPGPAISPTTNPQVPENPVNGTATVETASGATTSNSVDFYPYRSGPQSDPTNGEYPVLTAPIPVDDAAPTVTLAAPASANRGTTITLTATPADDFGIKRVRFADGLTTIATVTAPPYRASFTIPATAACNSVRTFSAVAMDSLGQTQSATAPVTVTCGADPQPTPTATVTATATVTVGGTVTPEPKPVTDGGTPKAGLPAASFISWPRSIAGKSRVVFDASAPAGLKSAAVILGTRTLCVVSAAPFVCDFSPTGADVGGQTLRLVVTDLLGETTEQSRNVVVSRFVATLKLNVSKKATKAGVKRTLTGTVTFPAAAGTSQACAGKVMLTIKRAGRSILNQEVPLSKRCTFSRSVTAKRGSQSFSAKVTFSGNTVLNTTDQSRRFS